MLRDLLRLLGELILVGADVLDGVADDVAAGRIGDYLDAACLERTTASRGARGRREQPRRRSAR